MTAFSLAEYRKVLRSDFHAFLMRCFAELHGDRAYSRSWCVEVIAARLAGVIDGEARRLIVNVPPRHLKSLAASVALPAWLLGRDPSLAIINVTYGQNLSDKFARDCRAIMTSAWYQALFPTRLVSSRPPFRELATTRGGFRLATSVGGVLTGRGADVILIDDPLKPADAMSAEPPRRGQRMVRFDALFAPQRQSRRARSSSSCSACTRTISSATCSRRKAGTSSRSPRSRKTTSFMRSRRRSGAKSSAGSPAKP